MTFSALASFQWCFSKGFVRKTPAWGYPPGERYFGEQRPLLCVGTSACLFPGAGAPDQGSSAPGTSSSSRAFSRSPSFVPCADFPLPPRETRAALGRESLDFPLFGKSMRDGRNRCCRLQTREAPWISSSAFDIYFLGEMNPK